MSIFPIVPSSKFYFFAFFREATKADIPSKHMELRITDTSYMNVGHGGECGTNTNLSI